MPILNRSNALTAKGTVSVPGEHRTATVWGASPVRTGMRHDAPMSSTADTQGHAQPARGPLLPEFQLTAFPRWALVRQDMDAGEIGDVRAAVRAALEPVMPLVVPGMRVCLTGGSRGIDRIAEVLRTAVERLREAGAVPFIVPAMGSHGGATADGQLAVLAGFGITPDSMGCEIRSSMDTVDLGEVAPGIPVYVDRNAYEGADLIVPVNRVKPHTGFTGPVESGLMKMIAIGMGKQKGADTFHRQGYARFAELIPAVARHTIAHAPIAFGLALVENGMVRLAHVEAVPASRIEEREAELLAMARAGMARLPLPALDVLIVDEMGKDISGVGMDPNVIGRAHDGRRAAGPAIQRIVIRGLTRATEGNAAGIGFADVALRRAVAAVDPRKTYMNTVTAKAPEEARIPLTVDTDREALALALATCVGVDAPGVGVDAPGVRMLRVRSTKHLDLLYASEAALGDVLATGRCEIVEPLREIAFDEDGMFVDDALAGS